MLRSLLLTVSLLLPFVMPNTAAAQDDADGNDGPTTMVFAYWKCDWSQLGTVVQQYDSLTRPIQQELVDEGLLLGAGIMTHDWADEWNVIYWRHAEDKAAYFAAQTEENRRFTERNPTPPAFNMCTEHRDGIYIFGAATEDPDDDDTSDR